MVNSSRHDDYEERVSPTFNEVNLNHINIRSESLSFVHLGIVSRLTMI